MYTVHKCVVCLKAITRCKLCDGRINRSVSTGSTTRTTCENKHTVTFMYHIDCYSNAIINEGDVNRCIANYNYIVIYTISEYQKNNAGVVILRRSPSGDNVWLPWEYTHYGNDYV